MSSEKYRQDAIVQDGCTSNGMHYFGVFFSFVKQVIATPKRIESVEQEHCFPLLSMSLLANYKDSEMLVNDDEATIFDCTTHVAHVRNVLEYYSLDLQQ